MLASSESADKDPGQQAPMVFMDPGGEFHYVNDSHWVDQKKA